MESIHTIKFRKWFSRATPVQKERLYVQRREASIVQYHRKREYFLEKVKCDVCGVCVCRQNMNAHQKTKRCMSTTVGTLPPMLSNSQGLHSIRKDTLSGTVDTDV